MDSKTLKREAERIRIGICPCDGDYTCTSHQSIESLCSRVDAEARKEQKGVDAEKCDGLAGRLAYASSEHWRRKAAFGITAGDVETAARLALTGAAAAIRNGE